MSAKVHRNLFLCIPFLLGSWMVTAQTQDLATDTVAVVDSVSVSAESPGGEREVQAVDAPVEYAAKDSIIYGIRDQKVYLFGEASMKYQTINLSAEYIEFDMGTERVFAKGALDSVGKEFGKPEFSEGSEKFQCKELSYNFRTKKGIITDIFTEQEGGYLHSATTKRHPNDDIHMRHGKYTTCDAEHPHFYIALTKAKSIPNDKIISGPAYLVLEDVPLPIGIPFGFFPSSQTNQSGFILPQYGEEERRGFYFRNGGFYFALSQYFDLSVTGDIYTNGTWGIRTRSSYRKNYKFNGSFGFNYFENISGEEGLENYSKQKNYAIRWQHAQDSRANPNQSFRASVDFSSTQYDQDHTRNINSVLRSTKQSSVSYSRTFPNAPFNFAASLRATQNSQTRLIDMNLPTSNFNMNRIYPLRRKSGAGKARFYEKLQVSYSSTLENRLRAHEDSLFGSSTGPDFNSGYQHNIPVSLPINFMNYFTLSPSVRYTGVIFTKSIHPHYLDGENNPNGSGNDTLIIDTVPGVKYAHAYVPSVGVSFTPKIYGMYQFREKSRIDAIRHVVSPSASFSYTPDMEGKVPNYYQEVVVDTAGNTRIYPLYDESVYRIPVPSGRQGSVSLNLKNTLEMKLRPKTDTAAEASKVKILDNLNFATNYSIFKDSLKWAPVRMTGNTSFFKRKLSLRFTGVFNPYSYVINENGRGSLINTSYLSTHGKLFRFTNFDFSLGMRFSSQKGGKEGSRDEEILANDPTAGLVSPTGYDEINYGAYVDFDIPWSFNMDYNFRYNKPFETLSTWINNDITSFL